MNLYYKIIYLHFRKLMPASEIAWLLADEIRASELNRRVYRSKKISDIPIHFVAKVLAVEKEQIYLNKIS